MTDCPQCGRHVDGLFCATCVQPARERAPRNPETVRKIREILSKSGWPKPERVPAVMREPGQDDDEGPAITMTTL